MKISNTSLALKADTIRYQNCFGDLAEDIRKELKLSRASERRVTQDLPEKPSLLDFRRALTTILRHPVNIQLYLVIILDEIEHICPPNADEMEPSPSTEAIPQFFGVLRKLSSSRLITFELRCFRTRIRNCKLLANCMVGTIHYSALRTRTICRLSPRKKRRNCFRALGPA